MSGSWRRGRSPPSAPGSGSWSDDDQGASTDRRGSDALLSRGGLGLDVPPETRRAYSPVAETLFRKDLISAMKLPDNEPLNAEDFWTVTDTWKQEWERGVQVPVKPDGLPEPVINITQGYTRSNERFAFPKKHLICMNSSGSYTAETHQVTPMAIRAEQVCTYDLDDVDQRWLAVVNGERALMGLCSITETEMERTVEELEHQCSTNINNTHRSSDDTELAQDDSIICDVCRSPDSEESNEMVFCDKCNICVHQACYGITSIPSGSWLCRTCTLGIKPPCELCPNKGGAMKSTRSGQKWAHVSCALWIPEVSIGCVEKMEPITKISSIPPSRWSLLCVLCKCRMGSCIQCSVKTCKTAYHVTCAFKHGLEMRAIIEDENAEDGVKLRSYCQKHSLNCKKKIEDSDSESGGRKKNMTAEEKSLARRQKLARVETEFYKLVDLTAAATKVDLPQESVEYMFRYWTLKRRAGGNKPLLPPRGEEAALISRDKAEDTERDKMKMLVSIRQDLERVRNLAYMVNRREKFSRSFVKLREQILEKQLSLLADDSPDNQMSLQELSAVIEANHGPTIYDKIYSHPDAEQHTPEDFECIISRLSGEIKEGSSQIRRDNPFRKKSTDFPNDKPVPYERIFSDTSQSESDDSFIRDANPDHVRRSSIDESRKRKGRKKDGVSATKKTSSISSKQKSEKISKQDGKSSSTSASKPVTRSDSSMSSTEEEEEYQTMISPRKERSGGKKKKTANIYSDSDSMAKNSDSDGSVTRGRAPLRSSDVAKKKLSGRKIVTESSDGWRDSEQSMDRHRSPVFRTKAAMKDFSCETNVARASKSSDITPKTGRRASQSPPNLKTSGGSKKSATKDASRASPEKKIDTVTITSASVSELDSDTESPHPLIIVPQRNAARRANERLGVEKKTDSDPQAAAAVKAVASPKKVKKGHEGATSSSSRVLVFSDSENEVETLKQSRGSEYFFKGSVPNSSDEDIDRPSPPKVKGKRKSKSPRGKTKQDTAGSDSEDQSESEKLSPRARQKALRNKKAGADSESESKEASVKVGGRKSPRKEAKKADTDSESEEELQKLTPKSKSKRKSSPNKPIKAAATDSDSVEEITKLPSPSRRKSSPFTQKKKTETHSDSKRKSSPVKQKNKADTDTDSNEDSDLPSKSNVKSSNKRENSSSDAVKAPKKVKRKNELSALLESEGLPYVPQRQAAKKASEKLNEADSWKKSQQEAYLNSIAASAALAEKAEKAKPGRGRPSKKTSKDTSPQSSASDSDMDTSSKRLEDSSDSSSSGSSSSDSSESVTPTKKSPRSSKSPKGPVKSPKRVQSPRAKQKQSPKKIAAPPKKANPRGKIHSSKALAYLNQREHQLDNIFAEFDIETDKSKKAPDKKLKTSEGRPDGFQSPPAHQKDTSDEKADEGSGNDEKADEESGAEQSNADLSIIGAISAEATSSKDAAARSRDSDSDHTPASGDDDSDNDDPKSRNRRDGGNRDGKSVVEEVGDRRTRTRSGDLNDSSLERRVPPRRSGRPSRDEGSSSRERGTRTTSGTSPAQSQQLKQSPQTVSPRQKKSIFSPVRSPGPIVDSSGRIKLPTPVGAGKLEKLESPRSKEEASAAPAWRPVSSRDRKLPESQPTPLPKEKTGIGEVPTQAKSPTKSPALSRSFEANKSSPMQSGKDKTPLRESPQVKSPAKSPAVKGSFESSRSSPMQNLRSPGFGRSSARHSQQPLNRSSDGIEPQHPLKLNECNDTVEANKLLEPKLAKSDDPIQAHKKSDVESTEMPMDQDEERTNRKLSVESKDSDADSAKSSMPELNGLPDLNKEDSADTIAFGEKLLESVNKGKEPGAQQSKMDEGYVSAEKVQADLVQSLAVPTSDTNAQNQESKKKEQSSQFLPQSSPSADKTKQQTGFELQEQSKPFTDNTQRSETETSNTSQSKPASTSAWSDQLHQLQEQHQHHLLQQQQLQQQQLQQQQLDEQQRSAWQQHYEQQQTDQSKPTSSIPGQKPHDPPPVANSTDSLGKARYDEKKGVDPLSASQQHQAAAQFLSTQTEALFSSMFNVQARKGLQAADLNSQQMYAAQKYMQDLYGGKGYGADFQNQMQNLDLLSQINYQNLLQYGGTHPAYMQQLQQYQQMSNKKPMSQEMAELQLLQSAYQQQAEMYAGGMYGKMGVDKTDLEKMALTRSGLSELEKMARQEQSKEKGGTRQQGQHQPKTGQGKRDIEGITNAHHERSASQVGHQRSQSQEGPQQRSTSQDGQQRFDPRLQDPMAHYRSQQEQMQEMQEKAQLDHLALQKEQMAREKAELEQLALEKAEQEKLAREKDEQEKFAREKAEQEKLAREKAEQERLAREKAEQERLTWEKAEQERLVWEKAEQERMAWEKAEQERLAWEKAEQERLAWEKAEQERLAREKAEQERIAREKAEQERIAREKAEQERLAREKAEQVRLERLAREKAEKERLAHEKAEYERLALEKAEQERLAREDAEQERLDREKAELEELAHHKAQQEQIAREKAQYEAFAKAQQEQMAQNKSHYHQMMHQKPQENHMSHPYGHMYGEQQMREHLTNQKASENHMSHQEHQQMRDIYSREMNHQQHYYDPMNPNKGPGSPKSENYRQHNQHDPSIQQNHLQQKPQIEKMQSSQYFDFDQTKTQPHRRPQQVSPKRPSSPKADKPSCRMEQEQYGIPSATPADKLPGFTPTLPHLRDRKHDSQDQHGGNQRRDCHVEQRRGRDTPGSVAGSDGSHNSAPSGIPCELLDSVMEMAKLPVCKPPDNVKPPATSPAKPPVHSPPKPAPVTTERDSSFDDLVRHIDSSPSQKGDPKPSSNTVNYSSTRSSKNELLKQSRSESKSSFKEPEKSQKLLELEKEVLKIKPIKPDAEKDSKSKSEALKPDSESPPVKQGRETRSRKGDAKSDKKGESDQEVPESKSQDNFGAKGLSLDLGQNDLNLSFNIAGGLLSDVGNHSSMMSERSAIGSDYEYDRNTMGGVDYDDIDDELPLATRKSGRGKASVREIPDISKWGKSKTEETKETKKKVPVYRQKPVDASIDTDDGKGSVKSLDESKASLPDFGSPTSESEKSFDMPVRRERKVPCYKTSTEATFDESPARVPFVSEKAKRGKARGAANSTLVRGKSGRGRGRVGGMFRSKGGPIYDEKAVEKVHRNLAGTDFDFENEFDDDVEYTPKERKDPGSLRDFRQQTKVEPIKPEITKKVPLYMRETKRLDSVDTDDCIEVIPIPKPKRDNAPEQNQIPPVRFDSDEEKVDSEPENESLASRSNRSRRAKASRGKAARGRSSRGRARKEPDHVTDEDEEEDNVGAEKETIDTPEPIKKKEKEIEEQVNVPKIPKLKIKFGGTDSPNSVETGSPDNLDNLKKFRKKKDRRGSHDKKSQERKDDKKSQERKLSVEVEEEKEKEKPLWIPKLKIKIGGPKVDKVEAPKELPKENIPKDETAVPKEDQILEKVVEIHESSDDDLEPPPLVIRTTPVSSPPVTPLIIRAPVSSPTVTPLIIKAPVASPTVTPLIIRAKPVPVTSEPTVTPLIIKTPLSSPTVKPRQPPSRPQIETEPTVVLEKLSTSELALQAMKQEAARSSPKSSSKPKPKLVIKTPDVNMASAAMANSLPSPKKPKGGIDFLANKLLARKQEELPEEQEEMLKAAGRAAEKQANDLASIFGPEVPLEGFTGKVDSRDDDSNKESVQNEPEGPSELELLALELGKELEMEKQKKQAQVESKKDMDPFEKSVEECIIQSLEEEVVHEDEKGSHKMFKYKIKAPSVPDGPITITPSLLPVPAKQQPIVNVISLTQMPPSAGDSNPLRRMRKKELLNQYYGIEVQPVSTAVTNGPSEPPPPIITTISAPPPPHVPVSHMREPPVRNIIKMPKAVASVTSVPTRADYQSQLEANMERKRRREGKDPIDPRGKDKKGKKGKGKQAAEEEPYVPKSKISPDEFNSNDDLENKNEGNRRTRGKPPKKCLADSPERDPLDTVLEDSKSESMKYAEQILRDFDKGDHPKKDREERRKSKKKRRRETEFDDEPVQPSTKTPRIVIKFSKDKSASNGSNPPKNITKENNGLTKLPPVILSKSREADATNPIPKLKLKVGGKL